MISPIVEHFKDLGVMLSKVSNYKKAKYFFVSERVVAFKFCDNKRFGWRNYFHAVKRFNGSTYYMYTGHYGNVSFTKLQEDGFCQAFWKIWKIYNNNHCSWRFDYHKSSVKSSRFSFYGLSKVIKNDKKAVRKLQTNWDRQV